MKKFALILIVACNTGIFVSCEKEANNVKAPKTSPKLVVGCFISPQDSIVSATVSESSPIFGNANNNGTLTLPTAVVKISDGTNSMILPYDQATEDFRVNAADFPIMPGKTYFIDVSAPNVKSVPVSASCTVPVSTVTAASAITRNGGDGIILQVDWKDIPAQKNYYRVVCEYVAALNGDTIYSHAGEKSLTDEKKDGSNISASLNIYYNIGDDFFEYSSGGMGELYKVVAYDIKVFNTESNYYHYFYSLNHYTYDDPFSEPSPVFTNVKNGLGVFSSYYSYSFRKE